MLNSTMYRNMTMALRLAMIRYRDVQSSFSTYTSPEPYTIPSTIITRLVIHYNSIASLIRASMPQAPVRIQQPHSLYTAGEIQRRLLHHLRCHASSRDQRIYHLMYRLPKSDGFQAAMSQRTARVAETQSEPP